MGADGKRHKYKKKNAKNQSHCTVPTKFLENGLGWSGRISNGSVIALMARDRFSPFPD
jgi:hypothetical protein